MCGHVVLRLGTAEKAACICNCISGKRVLGKIDKKPRRQDASAEELWIQLFSSNRMPQFRQLMVILPLPRGTRRYCPQLGHLK